MSLVRPPGPVRVLLIDADPRRGEDLRRSVQGQPRRFLVETVTTAAEGLRRLAGGEWHVCLVGDRLGGDEQIGMLRRARADRVSTPIVLLTAQESEPFDIAAAAEGAADVLDVRNIEPRRFARLLDHVIMRAHAEAELHDRAARLAEAEASAVAQKMDAIGRLAAGVAHDFNNLLTAILGYTDLLKNQCGDLSALTADLEEIRRAGRSAASLTGQLLAFSRKQALMPEVVSVNDMIEGMERLLLRRLGADIRLVTTLAPQAPRIEVDPVQLQQVLLNLADNAREAMPLGGTLTIQTSARVAAPAGLPAGDYLALTITDTGCGMDAATRARMFEPFFTTKAAGNRSGLGLATVYGIIRQTGGDIACESSPGSGATFSILLPATAKEPRRAAGAAATARQGAGTILLVEDQAGLRGLTRRILENCGYTVIEAHDPVAALTIARQQPVDALVADVVMPQLGGPELARQMRHYVPNLRVLLMAGNPGHSPSDDVVAAPLLPKPFTAAALAAAVADVLGGVRRHCGLTPILQ